MDKNGFFSWDDEITKDSNGFVLLPEGEYEFQVQKLEKGTYQGNSDKIGMGCPMVTLGLQIMSPQGNTSVEDKIYLRDTMEWKISSFYRSIGMKQHGKTVKMNWKDDVIIGKTGRCKIKQESYVGRDGTEKTTNKLDCYVDADEPLKFESNDLPFEI